MRPSITLTALLPLSLAFRVFPPPPRDLLARSVDTTPGTDNGFGGMMLNPGFSITFRQNRVDSAATDLNQCRLVPDNLEAIGLSVNSDGCVCESIGQSDYGWKIAFVEESADDVILVVTLYKDVQCLESIKNIGAGEIYEELSPEPRSYNVNCSPADHDAESKWARHGAGYGRRSISDSREDSEHLEARWGSRFGANGRRSLAESVNDDENEQLETRFSESVNSKRGMADEHVGNQKLARRSGNRSNGGDYVRRRLPDGDAKAEQNQARGFSKIKCALADGIWGCDI